MGILIGSKLPKILLLNNFGTVKYTILFTYKHFGENGSLNIDWPPEFAVKDIAAADTNRTLLERFNGYRFVLSLGITDKYLKTGAAASWESEQFEDNLNFLSVWSRSAGFIIRAYPYQDRTDIYYDCIIPSGGYVKTNLTNDTGVKTIAHDYSITLTGKTLTQTKPEPTTRPW